jgi:sugar lactone lactonase YvrE
MDGFDTRAPRFTRFILANAPLQQLAIGFRLIEELVWMGDAGCLLFQDLPRDGTMRWIEDARVSVYCALSEPGYADGPCTDGDGNLRSGTADDVHRVDPDRRLPSKVLVPFHGSNVTFGRALRSILLIGSRIQYARCLNCRGVLWP